MKNHLKSSSLSVLCLMFLNINLAVSESAFTDYIQVDGDRLVENRETFRFISFNIPNLLCIEDNMAFTEKHAWRLPDAFEIEDALRSVKQMGGTVARTYVVTVKRDDDMQGIPRHVLAPGKFNEQAFRSMDQVLELANKIGVRLIIPLVDNWKWMGGRPQYAAFRGKDPDDFWTDPQLKEDFKKTISYVLNRENTITGERYKDDKAILAWELGNELRGTNEEWISEMAGYVKSIDKNHLVNDGIQSSRLEAYLLDNPDIDILSTHHYENDPAEMLAHIRQSAEQAKGKKPYYVGEFGFISTTGIKAILDYALEEQAVSGALIWSLRFHNRDGGFYWHSEPMGGGLYKAYHWPGFHSGTAYDEFDLLATMRRYGFAIREQPPEAIMTPSAPVLLSFREVAMMSWQGSAGARLYMVERASSKGGPWTAVGSYVSDASVVTGPLFLDQSAETGMEYFYRVKAWNKAGFSEPSNVVGPVKIGFQVLVDEMQNFGVVYHKKGKLSVETSSARQFKEDFHRIRGSDGSELIYKIPGLLKEFNLFTYSKGRKVPISVSLSADGKSYKQSDVTHTNYFSGELDYDYWQPVLTEGANHQGKDYRFLKIQCEGEIQFGRIEISYEKW